MNCAQKAAWAAAAVAAAGVTARAAEPLVPAPQRAALLLEAVADSVQIYTCDAKGQAYEWAFEAPEANLFDKQGRQIGTHYAGPAWKTNDGTAVVGEVAAKVDAPEGGAIPWRLLRAKSHDGAGPLSATAFVRRAETKGGVAPVAGCDAGHRGEQVGIRYSALYQFFGSPK